MRRGTEIFIPIPKARNTKAKVEINGDDLTKRTVTSSFIYPVTTGIGTFNVKLANADGQGTSKYSENQDVKFYADNSSGETLQFYGKIDSIKEEISNEGKFVKIDGRHVSAPLTEYLICYSASNKTTSTILQEIIDKLPSSYGFTSNEISTTESLMSVEWNYKPFWDCVKELCDFEGYDCYVDNDLDFHYFEKNSIFNGEEMVVEGQNLISSKNWGRDAYPEKTRVIVMGQDISGLPIVYTAIDPNEGQTIKELFIKDSSANTFQKVKDLADAKLSEIINLPPQADITSYGLETVKPGDNIWFFIPRQEVFGQYKVVQINHKFGMKVGGWRTETTVENENFGISTSLKALNQKSDRAIQTGNINKLNYSFNYDFESDTGTNTDTVITEGVLKTTGGSTGTWISYEEEAIDDLNECELRVSGESIPGTVFKISVDGGATYHIISQNVKETISPKGKRIFLKVEINSASTQIYGISLLYS